MERGLLKIGILNIMHDKEDTKRCFERVLGAAGQAVQITYFYPVMHYQNRSVPAFLLQTAEPLSRKRVAMMDAFIITGAPLEKLAFEDVTYWPELKRLFSFLEGAAIPQLYVCWGAMAAANYFYGVGKQQLPQKIFGIYKHQILQPTPALYGLTTGFKAPHARYAELNQAEISAVSALQIDALTTDQKLFLVEAREKPQLFLFAHLEYGKDALTKEYQREVQAYPEKVTSLAKPENYYADPEKMQDERFSWKQTQTVFFANWLKLVEKGKYRVGY